MDKKIMVGNVQSISVQRTLGRESGPFSEPQSILDPALRAELAAGVGRIGAGATGTLYYEEMFVAN